MNTSITGATSDIHNPILQLVTERAGGASAAHAARLERVRADRALILADLEPTVPPFATMPARVGTSLVVDTMILPSIGYGTAGDDAPAEAGAVDEAAAGQGIVAQRITASTVTKRELAFLDDRSLTIEEKLFRFMALMAKKTDQDLVAKMKEISGNGTKSSSSGSSGTGGSTSGTGSSTSGSADSTSAGGSGSVDSSAGSSTSPDPTAIPGLPPPYTGMNLAQLSEKLDTFQIMNLIQRGDPSAYAGFFSAFDKVGPVVAQGVAWAAHEFAGPALGAAVTAMGLPELAPIANTVGSEVGDLVGNGVKSLLDHRNEATSRSTTNNAAGPATNALASDGSGGVAGNVPTVAKATSSTSAGSTTTSATDEQLQMMNLQRLVEKQNAMFAALSNVLKSLHDTRMAAVQNLR